MTEQLILIVGPTGVGKTARSIALAQQWASPVIVMDRIQRHPDLAVGSGRPPAQELAGTRRIYLRERPLSDGIVPPAVAVDLLITTLKAHQDHRVLVVEGGSISMINELTWRTGWEGGRAVTVECWMEGSPRRYEEQVARRVEQMLGYGGPAGGRTLLSEFAAIWPDPLARQHLQTVIGYREVAALCDRYGLVPERLTEPLARAWRYEITQSILKAQLDYSRWQRREFATALQALQADGATVEVHES